jgi:hypothetical protein
MLKVLVYLHSPIRLLGVLHNEINIEATLLCLYIYIYIYRERERESFVSLRGYPKLPGHVVPSIQQVQLR